MCGLIHKSACPDALRLGAIANPFEPPGESGARGPPRVPIDARAVGALGGRGCAVGIELLELREIDGLDISADAALGEGQRHPRLEMADDGGLTAGCAAR